MFLSAETAQIVPQVRLQSTCEKLWVSRGSDALAVARVLARVVSLSNRVRGEVEEGVPARRAEPVVIDEVRPACETETWAEMWRGAARPEMREGWSRNVRERESWKDSNNEDRERDRREESGGSTTATGRGTAGSIRFGWVVSHVARRASRQSVWS
jgi:hypothetical protein